MEGMLRSDAASPSRRGRKWVHVLLLISSSFQLLGMAASQVPSPGYYLGSKFSSVPFNQGFSYLWGPQHQSVSADKSSINLWLDRLSGSGFKSNQAYSSGYFGVSMKLPSGYSAGVVTCFYLSNNQAHPSDHDEVDLEFLGTVPGEPYILQTNLFAKGSGDGPRVIGREVRTRLWFDPTMDFHHYGILWNPDQLVFFVDDVPIRRYIHRSDTTFPARPMWVYGSIWDGSPWATDNGRYKVDYGRAPFTARYSRFILGGACPAFASCRPVAVSPSGRLSPQQEASLKWVQDHYTVYNYCWRAASASLTPECRS